jgi:hypothetical protein
MPEKKQLPPESALPEHESGVRRLVADANASEYHALASLAEARALSDAVAIFEGDFGGQIYVVAPIHCVQCEQQSLNRLLAELDALEWNEPAGASVFFERRAAGAGVAGGMGGGVVLQTVWVHERLKQHHSAVVAVLAGKSNTIHQ